MFSPGHQRSHRYFSDYDSSSAEYTFICLVGPVEEMEIFAQAESSNSSKNRQVDGSWAHTKGIILNLAPQKSTSV